MSLSDLSNVVISSEGPALTQVGFGTLLCAAYHTAWSAMTRTYTSLSEALADGFDSTDPVGRMLAKAFAQNPRPVSVKVGRLLTPHVQELRITPIAFDDTVYAITVSKDTTATASITSDPGDTVADICTALSSAITALSIDDVTATDDTTHITITMAEGLTAYLSAWDPTLLQIEDLTPDGDPDSIADDLAAIRLADADWYGLAIDVNSKALIEAAAEWAETDGLVIFGCNSSDWEIPTDATDDVCSELQALSRTRTYILFSERNTGSYAGAAALAERFPHDPGSIGAGGTFHGKTLSGVAADTLTPTIKGLVRGKKGTVYITTAGRAHTLGGESPSGEWVDNVRFLDWFRIRTEERIAALILDNERIPYTDSGVQQVAAAITAQLSAGVKAGGFAEDPAPIVVVPKVKDVSPNDKAARLLSGITASATLAGAIHKVDPVNIFVSN